MSEKEYGQAMEQAKTNFRKFRADGGVDCFIDWLWETYHRLFNEMQCRWRFQSSNTVLTGGVMFCPVPARRRR